VNKPEKYTVSELIAALQGWNGDLPVAVTLIGEDDREIGTAMPIRLERDPYSGLHITAYEGDEEEGE
jgi:hypothetical protein